MFGAMSQKKANKERFLLRQWFTIALTLLVLFSSCSTKLGVKSLLNLPISIAQTDTQSENTDLDSLRNNCMCCDNLQALTIDSKDTFLTKNLSPATVYTTVYPIYISGINLKEAVTPIHHFSSTVQEIPKYLLFNKLILHDA